MFSTLKSGAPIYILDKGKDPQLKIGVVESITAPQARISMPNYTGMAFNNDTTVDIRVKVGNEAMDFQKIPSNLSSATLGEVILCDNREDMLTTIDGFMQNSRQIVENIDYHKRVIEACDKMLVQLNPSYAKEKERDVTIESMKKEMTEIKDEFRGAMSEIKNLLATYASQNQNGGHSNKK